MQQILNSNTHNVNSHATNFRPQTIALTPYSSLPKFYRKVIYRFYELHLLGACKPNYSRHELAIFFKRNVTYLSTVLADLERMGYLESDPHGSATKRRWISLCAFSMLENQNQRQIQPQILPTPYIDLSDQEEINYKILKQEKNCGQLDVNIPIEDILDNYLTYKKAPDSHRTKIKTMFKTSPIGLQRKESLVRRLAFKTKDRPIGCLPGYFEACLRNEEKEIVNFCHILKAKPININFYDY